MKSKYFTLEEMLRSQTASRLGFTEQFNPPEEVVRNLEALCKNILDPLREIVGPLQISSGYRCPRLNFAVKGAKNSQHMKGQAADLHPQNITHAELFQAIKSMKLPFDQMIWEFGTSVEPAWVHVSYGPLNRKQIIRVS